MNLNRPAIAGLFLLLVMNKQRCAWCVGDPLYEEYHDKEWGVPHNNDQRFFESLTLEGAQAGLRWITVLRKREGYRQLFFDWNIESISELSENELEEIAKDTRIIRHKRKVQSVRQNAVSFLLIQKEFGSFSQYIWDFVQHQPIINHPCSIEDIPSETALSIQISKDLKKRGFSFVGSKIIYAFLQANGLVNDHLKNCWKGK